MTASIVKKKYVMYHTYKTKESGIYINEEDIFQKFEKMIPGYIFPKEIQHHIIDVLRQEYSTRLELIKTERERAQRELRDIRVDMDRLVDLRMD